jgi:hypothetical protein
MTDEQIKGIARAINPHWWNDDIDLLDFARAVLARAGQNRQSSGESHEDSLKSGEQARALVLADELVRCYHAGVGGPDLQAADELRRLHAEVKELHAECRVLVRQNGEWQAKVEADEALLQQALAALEYASSQLPLPHAREIEPTIKRLEERLK